MKSISVFLPGNVPSLKNSRGVGSYGQSFNSKSVQKYLRSFGIMSYSSKNKTVKLLNKQSENLFAKYFEGIVFEYPLRIGFHFVRGTKHKFDFTNMVQIIADLFTAHGFIDDDNMDSFLPYPLEKEKEYYSFDKNNPGVWLELSAKNKESYLFPTPVKSFDAP
jgi:hypothetical protein